jgi:hypothetical protein
MRRGISVLLLAMLSIAAQATVITVTNKNDSGPGSLRNANDIAAPLTLYVSRHL